jgi:hypothetical protein
MRVNQCTSTRLSGSNIELKIVIELNQSYINGQRDYLANLTPNSPLFEDTNSHKQNLND